MESSVTRLYLLGSFGAFGFIRSYLPRTGNMHNKLSFLGAWGEKKSGVNILLLFVQYFDGLSHFPKAVLQACGLKM